ncbi:hypothetical protein L1049_005363 [Liquidambar formosana]|uniref:Uncharacterized protein n=1 Tax=Liquidambar formosana TaxID=63359 RepID=A0AAP0X1M0_LIQFO
MGKIESLAWLALLCISVIFAQHELSPTASKENTTHSITRTCLKTVLFNLFEDCLRSAVGNSSMDVKGLARMMLELTLATANDTLARITTLLGGVRDPVTKV